MRYAIKLGKLIRGQKGQATISAAMILMLIGGILIPPCLGFAVVSLKASQSGEQVLKGRYAADSGVEAAIDQINHNSTSVANFSLNDRNVSVNITKIIKKVYKIISTATSDSGDNTTIVCYYGALDYSSLLDNAISTNGELKIQPGNDITGNISAPDCSLVDDCDFNCGCPDWTCCVDCPNCTKCCSEEPINWPTAEELSEYYYNKTKDYPYSGDTIDVATNPERGPLYRDGTLDIYNSDSKTVVNATLNGTLYVTGDLEIGKAPQPFILNLNNQTIFVESNSTDPQKAIWVGKNVQIIGSGCIIAVGDIYFAPDGDVGSPDNFVLIMSVSGTITLQPIGDFYGAVAGNAEVDLLPGNTLVWTSYEGEGVDFPIGQTMMKRLSYTIK